MTYSFSRTSLNRIHHTSIDKLPVKSAIKLGPRMTGKKMCLIRSQLGRRKSQGGCGWAVVTAAIIIVVVVVVIVRRRIVSWKGRQCRSRSWRRKMTSVRYQWRRRGRWWGSTPRWRGRKTVAGIHCLKKKGFISFSKVTSTDNNQWTQKPYLWTVK